MKARNRARHKGRTESGAFMLIPHAVMDAPKYLALSGSAVKLLNDLARQYKGKNNGDLCTAWRVMEKRGWKSRDTLQRAISELLAAGMIELTRQGGLHLGCNLYALTFHAIDECGGKLDVAASGVPSGAWKGEAAKTCPATQKNASPESVSRRPGIRVYEGKAA